MVLFVFTIAIQKGWRDDQTLTHIFQKDYVSRHVCVCELKTGAIVRQHRERQHSRHE